MLLSPVVYGLAENLEDPAGAARMAQSEVVGLVRRLIEFDGMDR